MFWVGLPSSMSFGRDGILTSALSGREAVGRIRSHLSVRKEMLASLGLAADVVTGFTIGGFVFAYPRPLGVVPLDTLRGSKLRGRVQSTSTGSTFSWRIRSPRIRAFPDHAEAEDALLRSWLRVIEHDLCSER